MFMGAERKPMIALIVACAWLGIVNFNLISLVLAIALWVVFHPLLAWMGKKDPNLIEVYLRSQRYPSRIPAFTTPFRTDKGYRIPAESKVLSR